MLEHMMFKGTKNYGTTDLKRDLALQQQIEAAYQVVLSEEGKRNPDRALIQAKRKKWNNCAWRCRKSMCPRPSLPSWGRTGLCV